MSKFTAIQRFNKKYKVDAATDCWLWFGATTQQNRPMFAASSGNCTPASRFIWEYTNGPIPAGNEIINICGIRICVNPTHLAMVSIAEHRAARSPVRGVARPKNDRATRMIIWLQSNFPRVSEQLDEVAKEIGKPVFNGSVWDRICASRVPTSASAGNVATSGAHA